MQATIDRIIFLRICEDRGIEPYGRLRGLCNGGGTYGRLKALFHEPTSDAPAPDVDREDHDP